MFIESFTGVTDKMDIQLQKSAESLLLITTAGVALNSTLVSVKVVTERGNKVIYQDVPLLDLAEIMSQDEGLYAKDMSGYVGNFPFSGARSVLNIPLAVGGAYQLQGEEYFSIDLKAVNPAVVYRLSAIESLDNDGRLYLVDKKAVPAPRTSQKWRPAAGAMYLALTRANLDLIRVYGRDARGNSIDAEHTVEILAGKSFVDNDIVAIATRTVATTPNVILMDNLYGFDNLFLVSLDGVEQYEVLCTGAAGYSFYEVRMQ